MESLLTTSNIVFAMGIVGTLFGLYKMFNDPQVALDKQQDLDKQEIEGKASVLAERATWDREQTNKRFSDMGVRLDQAFKLAENHTHTVDVKVDNLIKSVSLMGIEITRLSTIIEERIPRS